MSQRNLAVSLACFARFILSASDFSTIASGTSDKFLVVVICWSFSVKLLGFHSHPDNHDTGLMKPIFIALSSLLFRRAVLASHCRWLAVHWLLLESFEGLKSTTCRLCSSLERISQCFLVNLWLDWLLLLHDSSVREGSRASRAHALVAQHVLTAVDAVRYHRAILHWCIKILYCLLHIGR